MTDNRNYQKGVPTEPLFLMSRILSFLANRATSVFIGAILTWIFGLKLGPEFNTAIKENIAALLTTLATIAAGYIALQGPIQQMRRQEKTENEEKLAEKQKHRALVSIAASDLHNIFEHYSAWLLEHEGLADIAEGVKGFKKIELSDSSLAKIVNILPYENSETRTVVQLTIQVYQICIARTLGMVKGVNKDSRPDNSALTSLLVDWSMFLGLANHFFDLSRKDLDYSIKKLDEDNFRLPTFIVMRESVKSDFTADIEAKLHRRSRHVLEKDLATLSVDDFIESRVKD